MLAEKDNHKEIFTLMNTELFGGAPNPIVYFNQAVPIYGRKLEDDTLDRGQGYY